MEEWPVIGTQTGLAWLGLCHSLGMWALKILTRTLGGIAVVEASAPPRVTCLRGPLTPTHMENLAAGNGGAPTCPQVLNGK